MKKEQISLLSLEMNTAELGNIPIDKQHGWFTIEDFSLLLKREQDRCDRVGFTATFFTVDFLDDHLSGSDDNLSRYKPVFEKLLKAVFETTRSADLKSFTPLRQISVLLLDSGLDGAKIVIEKLTKAFVASLDLETLPKVEDIVDRIRFNCYPLHQVEDCRRIEATPLLVHGIGLNKITKSGLRADVLTGYPVKTQVDRIGNPKPGNGHSGNGSPANFADPLERQSITIRFKWRTIPVIDATGALTATVADDLTLTISKSALYNQIKRIIDVLGSLAGLLLFLPALLIISVLIKLSSRGPVLFQQQRIGYKGKPFTFFKFRTMKVDNNNQIHKEYVQKLIRGENDEINNGSDDEPLYKIEKDPRITAIGNFLRKTSMDELPQFLNVLRGEMSLVGPRPPIAYEVEIYKHWHLRRVLEAKPGITGLWQVYGRNKTTFDEMVRLDLQYIQKRSILYDMKLIFLTLKSVFFAKEGM